MKKKILVFFCALILLCGTLPLSVHAASGTAAIKASATSVKVGESVTVTVTYTASDSVGAGTSIITYDDSKFEFVSIQGTGTYNPNAAGVIEYTFADTSKKKSYTFNCVFKAKQTGNCTFQLDSRDMVTFDEMPFTVSTQRIAVSAINPTKSGNANLKYLKPSAGTLTPAFSPDVTAYTITVPYTVTSLLLTTDSVDQNAAVEVNGSSSMKVGKNVRSVTVTAPNGTTKTYTITITRAADQSGGSTTGNGSTTTTTTVPVEDPLEVTVNGTELTVADSQPAVDLPAGYAWEAMELSGVMVPAAKNKDLGLTLLYLIAKDEAKTGALYIYGEDGLFTLFKPVTVSTADYVLLPLPEGVEPPEGTVAWDIAIGDVGCGGYCYEDTAYEDIAFIYAMGPTGYVGWYVYDDTDGSIQRYRELSAPDTQTPVTEPQEETNGFVKFITDYRQIILICAAAAGGLALLIGAVVLVIALTRRGGKARH